MQNGWWTGLVLVVVGGCGFGDNHSSERRVDASTGDDDSAVAIDAAITPEDGALPPDAPIQSACVLVPQTGCNGSTPACDLTAADDGTTACRAVTKQGNSDSICVADTECRAGYTCLDGDAAATKAWCFRFCAVDTDCTSTGAGSHCVFNLTDHNGDPINAKVCSNSCDPYNQTGCPTGTGCLAYNQTGGDISDCAVMGTKLDGATCTADEECLPGSACITSGGVAKCRSYCKVGVAGTCPTSQTCVSFVDKINLGAVEYGACL
jgi:hypothetical protein